MKDGCGLEWRPEVVVPTLTHRTDLLRIGRPVWLAVVVATVTAAGNRGCPPEQGDMP
jgi:hypothetical protein